MNLSREIAQQLIDLNPSNHIDEDVARRQFEVILKGFNFLTQPGNDFLYIADEVGLGKTYIALGIASLMRYYSKTPQTHTDLILVPKRNLQFKWQKEIKQFVTHNFLQASNRVKSITGLPVGRCGDEEIHNVLRGFDRQSPAYHIYRITSFSLAQRDEDDSLIRLGERLPPELRTRFLTGTRLLKNNQQAIRRLFAYLLNCSFPAVDLLIVDEAHNFKHGIGAKVSYRNQVVSRLMGVVQEDEEIFKIFPDLRQMIKRKAKKVIFLSATPIDRSLIEIKKQMDCFLPNHQFRKIDDPEELSTSIKAALQSFLIRGVMSIKLNNEEPYTRNMYRQEHRHGNVQKHNQQVQKIEDDFQSMVIGLLQYKTIKELNLNHGNRFEIGMLAGFESFAESSSEKEYEQTANREEKSSKDQHVVRKIAESYYQEFNKFLPHPKQDNLVKVLRPYLERGEKALIFVRRIASVKELERKLLQQYEQLIIDKIVSLKQKDNPQIQQLLRLYQEQKDHEEVENTLQLLSARLLQYYSEDFLGYLESQTQEDETIQPVLFKELLDIYEGDGTDEAILRFRDLTRTHFRRRKVSSEYREIARILFSKHIKREVKEEENDPDEENQREERSNYFFDRFFTQKQGPGGKFRRHSYNQEWYSINYYLVNKNCPPLNWPFDSSLLREAPNFKESDTKKPIKRFEARQEQFRDALKRANQDRQLRNIHPSYQASTFLTDLLLGPCKDPFLAWVDKYAEADNDDFLEQLDLLNEILRGIFRNGSGRLPAYLAYCMDSSNFESQLIGLLKSSFPLVIREVSTILHDFEELCRSNFADASKVKRMLYQQVPIIGLSGYHRRDVSKTAAQFRMPGFPYILVATDIVKEGEDLHTYCKDIFHYGIAWNPSDMEQRTGRIDRIGSFCYKKMKDKESIHFDDKIHVFFPFLADTLEVNQVVKVFESMNKFIETFYDFATIPDRNHRAEVDSLVERIPEAIESRLSSKYDHQFFSPPAIDQSLSDYEVLSTLGTKKHEISEKLKELDNRITKQFDFFLAPQLKSNKLEISGTINIHGRRAPFLIKTINSPQAGNFQFLIQSFICHKSDLKKKSDLEDIKLELSNGGFELSYHNNMLIAQDKIASTEDQLLTRLSQVCIFADELEKAFTDDKDHMLVF